MALVLLVGAVLLTVGRGWARRRCCRAPRAVPTSAASSSAPASPALARRPARRPARRGAADAGGGPGRDVGQLLPHVALLAVTAPRRRGRADRAGRPGTVGGPWSAPPRGGAPLADRPRGASDGCAAAPQRGLLPLAGPVGRRRRRDPRRRPAHHLVVPGPRPCARLTPRRRLLGRPLLDSVHPDDRAPRRGPGRHRTPGADEPAERPADPAPAGRGGGMALPRGRHLRPPRATPTSARWSCTAAT